jgi:hypothetical protein
MLIKNVTVFWLIVCDRIMITLEDKDAFPNLCDNTVIRIDTEKGVGVQWCKDHINVNPEVISPLHGVVEKGEELKNRHIEFTWW